MKRFLFISCLVLLSSVSSLVAVDPQPDAVGTPIPGGYSEGMKVDKNGLVRPLDTSKTITFPTGVAVVAANLGLEREFYVSNRSITPTISCVSNVCGTGTKLDPFDGSTRVKFDAVWAYVATQNPRQFIVQSSITPYLTNGSLTPMSNCVISGFGATIKADTGMAVTGAKRWIIGSDNTALGGKNYCTIQGFKFDNNFNNQAQKTNVSIGTIYFYGAFNKFLYNKCVGWWGTSSSGLETFVVGAGMSTSIIPSIGTDVAFNEITQEVLPDTPSGTSGVTIISCGLNPPVGFAETSPSTKWNFSPKIHDNFIHDISGFSGSNLVALIGVGAWSVGAEIYNNTFLNIPVGGNGAIYSDTGFSWFVHIHNNKFFNVNVGIILRGPGSSTYGLTIENNHIVLPAVNPSYGILIDGASVDLKVVGNTIERWSTTGTNGSGIFIANATSGLIARNKVGPYTDHNTVSNFDGILRDNVFNILETIGTNNVKTDNNHKNDGTRLTLPTDTDVFQGGNATLVDFSANAIRGNMSGGTGYQARNLEVGTRYNLPDTNIVVNNADVVIVIQGPNTTTHTMSLPAASGNNGRFLYIVDESGDISTHAYTANLKSGAFSFNINNGRATIRSNGTHWVLWDLFTPP